MLSIKSIHLSLSLSSNLQQSDHLANPWGKLCYNIIINHILSFPDRATSSSFTINERIWTFIWHLNYKPKHKHHLYRLYTNFFATNENLFCRKLCPDGIGFVINLLNQCGIYRSIINRFGLFCSHAIN